MPERVEVIHTSVFAAEPGGGNPCPVVLEAAEMSSAQMQGVAQRFGQECGFVVSPVSADEVKLRFFVPEHEMSMCVHATVACVGLLLDAGRLSGPTFQLSTPSGQVRADLLFAGTGDDPPRISVDQPIPTAAAKNPTVRETAEVLGIAPAEIDHRLGPVQSWSASRPKLIVPLTDLAVLDQLAPVWERLWDLCEAYATTGIYAFAADPQAFRFHARQFPVRAGYPEDAATGVAAAALGGYLSLAAEAVTRGSVQPREPALFASGSTGPVQPGTVRYEILQGATMGRPSLLSAVVDWNGSVLTRVRIEGSMQTLSRETLFLDTQ